MYKDSILVRTVKNIVLALLITFTSFPIFFLVLSSFKEPSDIFKYPPRIFSSMTFENFRILAQEWPGFFASLGNSFFIAMGASVLTVLLAVPAGYAMSRHRNSFSKSSAFFMMLVRMFPPIVLTIPLFPALSKIGLIDSYWVLILLYCTFYISLSTWLMKLFIDEVPLDIEEAAIIDGASIYQRVVNVIFPLSIHGIISTIVFVVIFVWKEYTIAYIFTGTNIRTSPLVLYEMLSPVTGVSWGPLFAASTIQLIPILIFIWFVQGYLVRGLNMGSVKG